MVILAFVLPPLTVDGVTEIVQQSKARHKDDFPLAFAPIIPEAAAVAYKGATPDVQNKVRRVVEVWRDRSVFEGPIQTAIESRIDGTPADLNPCNSYKY